MAVIITGTAGFIGSNLVRHLLDRWPDRRFISVDLLTYSGSLENLAGILEHDRHRFVRADIADRAAVRAIFESEDVEGVIHLAAESHVDRSILDPMAFVHTNVLGTVVLLEEARRAWGDRQDVRFLHVSTDEVFGALGEHGSFSEATPYRPNSPYSASKASADHFVRAWGATYGLPVLITNCSNNYGPYQFPEKLIPVTITRALEGRPVPIYGRGENVRDWLYVEDHCRALGLVFERGRVGATYCIGGQAEVPNLELVEALLDELDGALGNETGASRQLIEFVQDRPGHDFRYSMDFGLINSELGWEPAVGLSAGLAKTVRWYLDNQGWIAAVRGDNHHAFEEAWYRDRGD